jgi:hypothetical protein
MTAEAGAVRAAGRRVTAGVVEAGAATVPAVEVAAVPAVEVAGSVGVAAGDIAEGIPA